MSRRENLKYNLIRPQYSLRFIIYMFILFDIVLFFAGVSYAILYVILGFQISNIIGLLIGFRGQAKYREFMFGLRMVADDPKLNDKEDMRGHLLKQQVRYACDELDVWMLKEKSTKKSIKPIKIKKNRGVQLKMNKQAIKELFYWVAGLFLGLGLIMNDILVLLEVRLLWILAFNIGYYFADFLFFWYLWNFWGIKKEDVKPLIPLIDDASNIIPEAVTRDPI